MDRFMLGATALFTTGTVIGTIVSFQQDVPGEPFGHNIRWSVLEDPTGSCFDGPSRAAVAQADDYGRDRRTDPRTTY